jgi:hypothetical protein
VAGGTRDSVLGQRLNFSRRGGASLAGEPDTSQRTWTILRFPKDSAVGTPVAIRYAWR